MISRARLRNPLRAPGIPGVTAKLGTGIPPIVNPLAATTQLNTLSGLGPTTGLQRLRTGIRQFVSQPPAPQRTIKTTLPKMLRLLGGGLP